MKYENIIFIITNIIVLFFVFIDICYDIKKDSQKKRFSFFNLIFKKNKWNFIAIVIYASLVLNILISKSYPTYINIPIVLRFGGIVLGICGNLIYLLILNKFGKHENAFILFKRYKTISKKIYYRIRHPLILGKIIFIISIIIIYPHWVGFILVILIIFAIRKKIKYDNDMLEKYGDNYREYIEQTGMFFPRFKKSKNITHSNSKNDN